MRNTFQVLIVEDEILTAKSLQLYLEKLGMVVLDPIARGDKAVNIALDVNPSLILMDIRLAGRLDGIEAAKEIHKKKLIPIIFMTGYATENIQKRAQGVAHRGFFEKPINFAKIRQVIEEMNNRNGH